MKPFNLPWIWHTVRSSYWFVPSVMVLGALVLSLVTSRVDMALGSDWLREVNELLDNRPDGARAVLSAIAGSMITVAGVTFSMTVVSVSFAAAQFGPRLVGNFMRDTGNQITLGVFIATFVYCLMALRTVRSAPTGADAEAVAAFVPHVTVLVALLLALACVAVLIYYIHHVPETINIANITAGVGRALKRDVAKRFPATTDAGTPRDSDTDAERFWQRTAATAEPVVSRDDGYLQFVDLDALLRDACERDVLVRLAVRPGDFVSAGDVLCEVAPAGRADLEAGDALRCHFRLGRERTPDQNVLFLVDELVEILARALSPGMNDPFTAIGCLHWLRSALGEALTRDDPPCVVRDDDGAPRILARPVGFGELAAAAFEQSLPYVRTDRNVTLTMLDVLTALIERSRDAARTRILFDHGERLARAADESLRAREDREEIARRFDRLRARAV